MAKVKNASVFFTGLHCFAQNVYFLSLRLKWNIFKYCTLCAWI